MDNAYAIEVLERLRKKVLVPGTPYYEVVSFCIQLLKRADEKSQGEWKVILHKDLLGRWSRYYEYECSVCHKSYLDNMSDNNDKFCRFCGARMKGVKSEN